MPKIPDFTKKVYELTKQTPKGRVTTYKAIAQALNTKAYRAVGRALRNNPYAPQVPCHRVIKSDGSIGGFNGKITGKKVQQKIRMLKKEGIKFQGNKIKKFMEILFIPK
jgi:methylated-DNA-[protein]-cysteine S-methyltransferase